MVDYNSLYFGKVIFDTDLLSEADDRPYNRVKVLINGVTGIENESFTQPRGQNNPNRLSNPGLEIVGEEFYAYVLQPVMGNSSGVRYNATKDIVSVNDVGDIDDQAAIPPAEAYHNVTDGYVGGYGTGTAGVNPMAAGYSPDNRSNAYKGMMSLPGVGSSVVVSFMNGKRGMPIIIGVLPSGADVDSIHGVGVKIGTDGKEIYPNYPLAFGSLKGPPIPKAEEVFDDEIPVAELVQSADGVEPADYSMTPSSSDLDFSDIPEYERKKYDTFIENGRPELAVKLANGYRSREKEIAEVRRDTIEFIRENVSDDAANKAAAQQQAESRQRIQEEIAESNRIYGPDRIR